MDGVIKMREAVAAPAVRGAMLVVGLACLLLESGVTRAVDAWRVLPIRSQQEFERGKTGGEAEQHLHGIARSLSDRNRIY